jgi:hypothetical protein
MSFFLSSMRGCTPMLLEQSIHHLDPLRFA